MSASPLPTFRVQKVRLCVLDPKFLVLNGYRVTIHASPGYRACIRKVTRPFCNLLKIRRWACIHCCCNLVTLSNPDWQDGAYSYGQKTRTHCFARIDLTASGLLFISGPQVRSLYGPPIKSTTYVVHASTSIPVKSVLNLFSGNRACLFSALILM